MEIENTLSIEGAIRYLRKACPKGMNAHSINVLEDNIKQTQYKIEQQEKVIRSLARQLHDSGKVIDGNSCSELPVLYVVSQSKNTTISECEALMKCLNKG